MTYTMLDTIMPEDPTAPNPAEDPSRPAEGPPPLEEPAEPGIPEEAPPVVDPVPPGKPG